MRTASIAVSLALAVSVSASGFVAPGLAATENSAATHAAAQPRKKAVQPLKPTWEQCFDMSTTRGFNHDLEEWQQSIQDCLAGKLPL